MADPVPLLNHKPTPWRCQMKFRVLVPAQNGEPALLSQPLSIIDALCVARAFTQQNVLAAIMPNGRTLRTMAKHAHERGVILFNGLVGPVCQCGCGKHLTHIVFPPHCVQAKAHSFKTMTAAAEPAVSPETPKPQLKIIDDPENAAPLPKGFVKQLAAKIVASVMAQITAALKMPTIRINPKRPS